MVKKFFYISLLLLICTNLFAQNIDSLRIRLNSSDDSTKVLILNQMGDLYLNNRLDSSIRCFNKALLIGNKIAFNRGIIMSTASLGSAYKKKNETKKAISYYKKAIEKAQEFKFKDEEALHTLDLSDLIKESDPVEAHQLTKRAWDIYHAQNNEEGKAKVYFHQGLIYKQRSNFEMALDLFTKAITQYRRNNDDTSIVGSLLNAADIYQKQDKATKALEYYYQVTDIGDKYKNFELSAITKIKIAGIYQKQQKFQQAINLYNEALRYFDELKDLDRQMEIYTELGNIYKERARHKSALAYFFKSQEIAKKLGAKKILSQNYIHIAKCYLVTNKPNLAAKNIKLALSIAKTDGFVEECMKSYLVYYDIYMYLVKPRIALSYYKKYTEQMAKFDEENKQREIALLKNEFKYRERELEIALQENERAKEREVTETEKRGQQQVQQSEDKFLQLNAKNEKLKNNTLIGGMIFLLLFSIGTIIAYKNKLDDNKALHIQKDDILKKKENLVKQNQKLSELNDEKDNLVNMVAHDLRSPLDQIKGLVNVINAHSKGDATGQEYLDMISFATERMRNMISRTLNIRNIENTEITMKGEIFDVSKLVDNISTNFIELANKKDLTIHTELQKNGCNIKADINYMIQVLENLISNAIKFSPTGKSIRIKVGKEIDKVKVQVIDEGPGIRKEDMPKLFKKFQRLAARPTGNEDSTGLGLSIVKRFVETMGGKVSCESIFGKGSNFILEFESYEEIVKS